MSLKNGSMMLYDNNEKAVLNIFGDICSESWETYFSDGICPQDVADLLDSINKFDNIDVHINSGGGDAFAGIAIYNTLKRHEGNVTVYVDGLAASSASVIAMAGNKIIMPKSAQIMIHQPWTFAIGNASELRKTADNLDTCTNSIMAVYSENKVSDVEDNEIRRLVDAETWLTAEQAKEYFANIEIEDRTSILDSVPSVFYCKYKNKPKSKNEIALLELQLAILE